MKKLIWCLLFLSGSAFAYDWDVVGKVTRLEPSFVPDHLNIRIDTAAGSCPAGIWIFYGGNGSTEQDRKDSVKAAYAALLSSLLTGTSVEFYGFNTNCTVGQMHVLKQ